MAADFLGYPVRVHIFRVRMAPKKAEEPEKKPIIGRVGTNLRVGIVGVPNVGKSTFFNVLTKSSIPAENFPFCTIDPNESRVPVPDARFDYLVEYHKPASKVPAYLNVVDIAGLVKGAAEGAGLGNNFLSHISACDAIFHLLRELIKDGVCLKIEYLLQLSVLLGAFEDEDVTHVEGEVNPVRDCEIISEELRLKDQEKLEKDLEKLERTCIRGNDKKLKPEYDTLVKIKGVLVDEKKQLRFGDWSAHDVSKLLLR